MNALQSRIVRSPHIKQVIPSILDLRRYDTFWHEMKRTPLRAVSIDEREWKAKGAALLKQAENVSKRTTKNDRQKNPAELIITEARNLSLISEIELTIKAGEAFKIAGLWYESAKAFARAAALIGDPRQAASYYLEAGIAAEKVNDSIANDYYSRSISMHCNVLEFKEAAMLLERMANNLFKADEFVASLEEFQRASKLYKAAGKLDDADRTLERAAYLQGRTGDLIESSNSYKTLAMSQTRRNTTVFNAPRYALRSIILLCLEKSFSEVQDLIDDFRKEDCRFEESREMEFIQDIMHSISFPDLDKFADCVYSFNAVCELDDLMLESLEVLMKTVVQKVEKDEPDVATR